MKSIDEILAESKEKRAKQQEKAALLADIQSGVTKETSSSLSNVLAAIQRLSEDCEDLTGQQREIYVAGISYLQDHYNKLSTSQQKDLMGVMKDMTGLMLGKFDEVKEHQMKAAEQMGQSFHDTYTQSKPRGTYMGMSLERMDIDVAHIRGLEEAFERMIVALNDFTEKTTAQIASVKIQHPDIHMPAINVPEARVKVDIPEIKMPEIKMPEIKLPEPKKEAVKPTARIIEELHDYDARGNLVSMTEKYDDGTIRKATGFNTGKVKYTYSKGGK